MLIKAAARFWSAYAAGITWEPPEALEGRAAALLPALMLARVDGKSPVEYLSGENQDRIRELGQAPHPQRPGNARPGPGRCPAGRGSWWRLKSGISSVGGSGIRAANPTVEVEVELADGTTGRAAAPAGASRGAREAVDLRDGGSRLGGMDVGRALDGVNGPIAAALRGMEAGDQQSVDDALIRLDGTANKARLGGNATVATSLAVQQAAAASEGRPLWAHLAGRHGTEPTIPLPEIQIFGGGAHAGRRVDIQDFMVMVPGADSFGEALEITSEIHRAAGAIMERRNALSRGGG